MYDALMLLGIGYGFWLLLTERRDVERLQDELARVKGRVGALEQELAERDW